MTKAELFDKDFQHLARIFKALGHPARLAILDYIANQEVCITGDISNHLPLSRSTVNQHLEELRSYGIIKGEIEGVKVNYCIDRNILKSIKEKTQNFLGTLEKCNGQNNCST